MEEQFSELVIRLSKAKKIFVITGAGISAESGIPTFRGKDGWWKNNDPMKLASPEGFAENPQLVWEWYNYRKRMIRESSPNQGHITLAEMEKYYPHFLLATQNVDRFHQRAGSKNVAEIHGTIVTSRCTKCTKQYSDEEKPTDIEPLPRCDCGGLLRPDVVWFGELLPQEPLQKIDLFLRSSPGVDVAFVIGTSALFQYIQNWAHICVSEGAFLVEINLEPTSISSFATASFFDKSGKFLPVLWREVRKYVTFE